MTNRNKSLATVTEQWRAQVLSSCTETNQRSSYISINQIALLLSITGDGTPQCYQGKLNSSDYSSETIQQELTTRNHNLLTLLELKSMPKSNEERTANQESSLWPLTAPAIPKPFEGLWKKQSRPEQWKGLRTVIDKKVASSYTR